jgi:uncharacterized membrane protein YphA (DoxX/SURF4 family)
MRVGIWVYGVATVITGILDIVWAAFEPSHQPLQALGEHIPGSQILACIAGAWLVAAGLAILWRRTERRGALGTAAIYLIFALLWLPRFYSAPRTHGFQTPMLMFIFSGMGAQLLLVAPALIVYVISSSSNPAWRERAIVAARWILGWGPITIGLSHLMNVQIMAHFVPTWAHFPAFWAVFSGIAFLLAGLAIISGIQDVLAARLLAFMLLLFEATVEIPPVFGQPHSQSAWGGAVYNITAIGACLVFSEFVIRRRQDPAKNSVASQTATHYANTLSA